MSKPLQPAFSTIAVLCFAACGSDPDPGDDLPTIVESGLVQAGVGARVVSADGVMTLTIGPGALAEDTTISVTPIAPGEEGAGWAPVTSVVGLYELAPDGLRFEDVVAVDLDLPASDLEGGTFWTFATVGSDDELSIYPTVRVEAPTGRAQLRSGLEHFTQSGLADLQITQGVAPDCAQCALGTHGGLMTMTNSTIFDYQVWRYRLSGTGEVLAYPEGADPDTATELHSFAEARWVASDTTLSIDLVLDCGGVGAGGIDGTWLIVDDELGTPAETYLEVLTRNTTGHLPAMHADITCVDQAGPTPGYPAPVDISSASTTVPVDGSVAITVATEPGQNAMGGGELCVVGTDTCGLTRMNPVNPTTGEAMVMPSPPAGQPAGTQVEFRGRIANGANTRGVIVKPAGMKYEAHEYDVDQSTFEDVFTGVVYLTAINSLVLTLL